MDTLSALNEPTYGRVRDRIREEILAGTFKPGQRLRVAELAERYQVSPMPIREALQSLQGEGLVELVPNRGASVRRLDSRAVSNMYDIRGAIESMLARKAAAVASEADVAKLVEMEAIYERLLHENKDSEALEANHQFHLVINRLAQNEEALRIFEQYSGLIHALRRRFSFGEGRLDDIVREHEELIEAMRTNDEELAQRVALQHCQGAKEDLLHLMAQSDA